MKRIISILAVVIITAGVFAQAPQKMSYQAVIRNGSDSAGYQHASGHANKHFTGFSDRNSGLR